MTVAITLTEEVAGDETTVRISGDLDIHTRSDLQEHLHGLIARGARVIRLDLSDVEYVGSVAIAVMIEASKRLQKRGGRLVVVPGSSEARKHFGLLNLDHVLEIEKS